MNLRKLFSGRFFLSAFALTTQSGIFIDGQTNSTIGSSTRLSLAASNPFRMVLRPTYFELDFVAVSVVEEAMSTAILQLTNSSLVDVNININQMNWLSSPAEKKDALTDDALTLLDADDVPITVLKFFAVGTFLTDVATGPSSNSGSLASVKKLDYILEQSFKPGNYVVFIELLKNSEDPLLKAIQEIIVIPTVNKIPVPDKQNDDASVTNKVPTNERFPLTTLDIVLIAVSGAIFLGIVYMIFQHHKDRGYIENQRIRTANAYRPSRTNASRQRSEEGSNLGKPSSMQESNKSVDSSKTSVVNNRGPTPEPSSNNSPSLFTNPDDADHSFAANFSLPPAPADIMNQRNPKRTRFSSKVRISVQSTQDDTMSLPPAAAKSMVPDSSVQSLDDKSECKSTGALSTATTPALSSDFGATVNWFRKSCGKNLDSVLDSSHVDEFDEDNACIVSKESAETKRSTTSSSSNCSDGSDVFQVAYIRNAGIKSVANESDNMSKASSVVMEWMKTIRVIPSTDSKSGSEFTYKASLSEESSTVEDSVALGPPIADEDEVRSLEHSMANSKALEAVSEEESTMEF